MNVDLFKDKCFPIYNQNESNKTSILNVLLQASV